MTKYEEGHFIRTKMSSQENTTIISIHAQNKTTLNYMTELKGEIHTSTVIVKNFSTSLSTPLLKETTRKIHRR